MVVNRYTRLTPSEFNPMSLEEMMMVPLAKQKQQEDILNNSDAIEAELSNIKRLQPDDELVTGKASSYKDNLSSISDTIANEGINKETTRNFRKLYNNYKFDISDSGELGKAQNNYNLAKQREAVSRKSLAQAGHSQSAIDRLVEKGYSDFKGTVDENGGFREFGNFGGPGFYDYRKEAVDIFSRAKSSGISIGKSGSDIQFITDKATGSTLAQVTNTALTEEQKENAEQIAAAYNSMVTSYSYGDRKEFADLYDLSPERLQREFKEISGAFESDFSKSVTDSRTSIQNMGKPNRGSSSKTTVSPRGDTWETIPAHARSGKDGGTVLGNRLTSDANLTYQNARAGFRGGTITDYRQDPNLSQEERMALIKRDGVPGANAESSGATEMDGAVLEKIFVDPGFLADPSLEDVEKGARGAGIYTNGNNLTITTGIGKDQLAIQGTYDGKEYNLTIQDPSIVRAFDKYGTSINGKRDYIGKINESRKLANDLRSVDPFMANMSDQEIAKAYENTISTRAQYFQNGYKPKNVQNSYYSQTDDLFGKGNNLGTITTRKVRMFTEDGTEITDFKNSKGVDKLSNLLMDNEYDDLNETEREEFHKQLRNSTDFGLQIGDHEFVNPMRRSVTTPDGETVFLMIDNNNELSGKNAEFAGIDDSSEMQRYLLEGRPFIRKPSQLLETPSGETVEVNQWFIHVPRLSNEGNLEIYPMVIYGKGDYNSLEEMKEVIDFETMQPKEGAMLKIESQDQVDARVKTNLNKYYDRTANGKLSRAQAEKY